MKRPLNVAIMTATITPPAGVPGLARTDPKVRLEDYRSALEFYLSCLDNGVDRIVFAENSKSELQPLRDLAARAGRADCVEFLSIDDREQHVERGRCYAEMRLLDQAMQLSETIRKHEGQCIVWKLTGRYKVRNLPTLIRRRPADFDLYCDMRHGHNGPWCDMRVMAWTQFGYETALRGVSEQLNTGYHGPAGESQMYKALLPRLRECRSVTSYLVEPYVDGARGFDNKQWNTGRQLLVYYLRALQRRLFGHAFV